MKEVKAESKSKVSKSLSRDIDNILENGAIRTDILLKNYTPKVLVDAGMKDLPMLMKSSHIIENILTEEEAKIKSLTVNKYIHYHGLGKGLFVKAIESLDNPSAVFQWQTNNHNKYGNKDYIVLTNLLNDNNQRIIVALYIETKGNYSDISIGNINQIDTNKVKSIYGRNKIFTYLYKYIKDGSLKRVKIKERLTTA